MGLVRLPTAVGLASAAAGTWWVVKQRSASSACVPPFTVMSWNLLARPYTRYEAKFHKNPNDKLETKAQTAARYKRAADLIRAERPEAVLLQECEAGFFKEPSGARLLDQYTLAKCFTDKDPGTAVLLRSDAFRTLDSKPLCIGGTSDVGGPSKVCSIVRFEDGLGHEWKAASCHTTWDGAAASRQRHVELLEPVLGSTERFVLGGDWNAKAGKSLVELREATWLKRVHLVDLDAPRGTCISSKSGKGEHIDHFFVPNGTHVERARALYDPQCPYGEGSPAEVVGASDHVPIVVDVSDR